MSVISARVLQTFACLRQAVSSRPLLGRCAARTRVQGAVQSRPSILCAQRRQKDAGAAGATRKQLKTNVDVRACGKGIDRCAGVCLWPSIM